MTGRPHKYGAKRTEVDGIMFASKAEARRYSDLKLMQESGEIAELELQPRFQMHVNGKKVGSYIADFRYVEVATGRVITEDVKGVRTSIYRLKKKIVEALYDIEISEVA